MENDKHRKRRVWKKNVDPFNFGRDILKLHG